MTLDIHGKFGPEAAASNAPQQGDVHVGTDQGTVELSATTSGPPEVPMQLYSTAMPVAET